MAVRTIDRSGVPSRSGVGTATTMTSAATRMQGSVPNWARPSHVMSSVLQVSSSGRTSITCDWPLRTPLTFSASESTPISRKPSAPAATRSGSPTYPRPTTATVAVRSAIPSASAAREGGTAAGAPRRVAGGDAGGSGARWTEAVDVVVMARSLRGRVWKCRRAESRNGRRKGRLLFARSDFVSQQNACKGTYKTHRSMGPKGTQGTRLAGPARNRLLTENPLFTGTSGLFSSDFQAAIIEIRSGFSLPKQLTPMPRYGGRSMRNDRRRRAG